MADPVDPHRPPGGYLPRIAKFEAPEEEDDSPSPRAVRKAERAAARKAEGQKKAKSKAKGKGKAGDGAKEDEDGIPLVETFEGRVWLRRGVGVGVVLIVGLLGFLLYRSIFAGADDEGLLADLPAATDPNAGANRAQQESEARDLIRRAREAGQGGNSEQAIAFLRKVQESYPGTPQAREADEAFERRTRGLPLFALGPEITAEKVEKAAAPPDPPVAEVVAEPPKTADASARSSDAEVTQPAVEPALKAPGGSILRKANVEARPLPVGFRARVERGNDASGWPIEIVDERDGAVMVFVPGGTFTIGRDDGPASEKPARQVALSPFYIDQNEVTVGQFERFRAATGHPSIPPAKANGADTAAGRTDLPVVMVNHADASAYALWAGKYLPTEAQWELAARTTDGRSHPWGRTAANWDRPRAHNQIDPVFSYLLDMSPYGVFDLAGNAWEWTDDYFDAKSYQKLTDGAANPTGPAKNQVRQGERSVRGGAKDWNATWRSGLKPEVRLPYLGFRCVLPLRDVPPPSANPGATGTGAATPSGSVPF